MGLLNRGFYKYVGATLLKRIVCVFVFHFGMAFCPKVFVDNVLLHKVEYSQSWSAHRSAILSGTY